MFKLCTNKNHSYKHNEQINNQNIDNSECFGVKLVLQNQPWHYKYKLDSESYFILLGVVCMFCNVP
jgi:hypothetical protein